MGRAFQPDDTDCVIFSYAATGANAVETAEYVHDLLAAAAESLAFSAARNFTMKPSNSFCRAEGAAVVFDAWAKAGSGSDRTSRMAADRANETLLSMTDVQLARSEALRQFNNAISVQSHNQSQLAESGLPAGAWLSL